MRGCKGKDCGTPLERRKGRGRQREYCDACKKARHRTQSRASYQKTHPNY